jgi:hypothetical protein
LIWKALIKPADSNAWFHQLAPSIKHFVLVRVYHYLNNKWWVLLLHFCSRWVFLL